MTEKALLQAIANHPDDIAPRLAYADWLEERGDARAQEVRAGCQYRLPVTREETRHLDAVASARASASADLVVVAVSHDPRALLAPAPAGLAALRDDLHYLAALEVARNFPRDDKGRLQVGAVALLTRYLSAEPLPRYRELWLVAEGPARRSASQVITVRLYLLIGDNHPHNWSRLRWWWDARAVPLPEEERWGVTGAALRMVTGPRRGLALARLRAAWREGTLSRAERVALCTALQDEGRFEEALRLCEVEYPEEVSRLLNAEKFHLRGGCDHPSPLAVAARAAKLRRALWEAAPWRFADALEAAQARLDAWRQERPGRGAKTPQMRLFIFPGSKHSRKPCLMLVRGAGGGPRLSIEFTASNVVCPVSEWKRPVELDIARSGSEGAPLGGD